LTHKAVGNLNALVDRCFECVVLRGYLSALSRPEQVVHFFRQAVGVPPVSEGILSQRIAVNRNWAEDRPHHLPALQQGLRRQCAPNGVRYRRRSKL
jgi:hypothetical protein